MKKPRAVLAAAVLASFLAQSCFSVNRHPMPDPELRNDLAVYGVVLGEGPEAEVFEFAEVHEVRWTETALVISGVTKEPDGARGEATAVSFPLDDIDEVLVRELNASRVSIVMGGVIMVATVVITFLVTGKSQDGVPIGTE